MKQNFPIAAWRTARDTRRNAPSWADRLLANMISVLAALLFLSAPAVAHPGDRFTQFAGVSLGHATLAEVQSRYGKSQRRESRQSGEYEAWICYTTPSAEVQFKTGELGGGTQVLAFVIQKAPSSGNCPRPAAAIQPVIAGITLGLTRAEFKDTVGSATTWSGRTGTAVFQHQLVGSAGSAFDVLITVTGTFQNGRLTKFEVWKVITN